MQFPDTNIKFEKTSIDGYAFLGWARELIGNNTDDIVEKMEDMGYGLGAAYNIRGVPVPESASYVYSCFAAFEFYRLLEKKDKTDEIIDILDKIGRYDNGMMKYCTTEIDYLVPNVTPLAALMYHRVGRVADMVELLDALGSSQMEGGNWYYTSPSDGVSYGNEDSMHLCMMVYALCEVGEYDIAERAIKDIIKRNTPTIQGGTIGWGYPWLMLVSRKHKKLHDKAKQKTDGLLRDRNANFRARAMAVWALATLEGLERGE